MDYLAFLPTEIWRNIFLELPIYRTAYTTQDTMEPLMFKRGSAYATARKMQKEKLELLTTCKAIYPLVIKLLYTEVFLPSEHKIRLFVTSVANSSLKSIRGATRMLRIHLSKNTDSKLKVILDSLRASCPNVISLEIYGMGRGTQLGIWQEWFHQWKDSLIDLRWSDMAYQMEDLFASCQVFLRLESLTISGKRYKTMPTVSLPTVKRFRLQEIEPLGMRFPSLEWLQTCVFWEKNLIQLDQLIIAHKATLRGLEVDGELFNLEQLMTATFLEGSELESLILYSSNFQLNSFIYRSSRSPRVTTPVPSIITLYIHLKDDYHLKDVGKAIKILKLQRFTRMQFLFLIVTEEVSQAVRGTIELLTLELPEVTVVTQVDPSSSIILPYKLIK